MAWLTAFRDSCSCSRTFWQLPLAVSHPAGQRTRNWSVYFHGWAVWRDALVIIVRPRSRSRAAWFFCRLAFTIISLVKRSRTSYVFKLREPVATRWIHLGGGKLHADYPAKFQSTRKTIGTVSISLSSFIRFRGGSDSFRRRSQCPDFETPLSLSLFRKLMRSFANTFDRSFLRLSPFFVTLFVYQQRLPRSRSASFGIVTRLEQKSSEFLISSLRWSCVQIRCHVDALVFTKINTC